MKQRKNILIITAIFPYPLTSGGAQGQFGLLNILRKEHNFFLMFNQDRVNTYAKMRQLSDLWPEVSFIPYPFRIQLLNPIFLFNILKRGFQSFFTPNSERFQIDRAIRSVSIYQSRRMERFIRNLIDKYNIDIVQTEFYPAIGLVSCLPDNVKKVFIQHEIHFIKNERLFKNMHLNRKELKCFAASRDYEIACLNSYDVVVTVTEKDKELLEENGVTSTIYVSSSAVNATEHPYMEFDGRLTFLGANSHIPNQEGVAWLLGQVAPMIKDLHDISLDLIGDGWDAHLSDNDNITVNVRGYVDDLSEAIRGSIMVVPILSGSGMRMKILEAAANSVPFITTSVGVEGLDFRNGESCLIADTPEGFADAVRALTSDSGMCRKLGEGANEVFREKYTAKVLAQIRNEVYLK